MTSGNGTNTCEVTADAEDFKKNYQQVQNIDARGGLALYQKPGQVNLEAQYFSKNDESNKQLELDYIDLKVEQRKKSHSRQHIEKSQNMDLFIVDMEPSHKDTNPSMLIQNNKPIK